MSNQIETLFSGNFYIDRSYGVGLVPALIKLYKSENFVARKESDVLKTITRVSIDGATISNGTLEASGTEQRVVVLAFKQPVVKFSTYDWLGTQTYIRILNQLKNDPTVVGVVVDGDSGGGQVYGTPETYDAVAAFVAVKPFVFYTGGYACSGMYYIAAPSSYIIANKRADAIGSIGAYCTMVNYDGILEHFGAKVNTMYSSLSEDKNKNHRAVEEGGEEGIKQYIREELDPMVITFHNDMKAARPQLNETVFKGGTWNGVQSLEMGLIDANGSLEDAVAKVFELANTNKNSNKNQSNKPKTMSKTTKSFPAIQSILGIEGEGIATISTVLGNKGVQLTEAQLETIEASLAGNETALSAEKEKVTTAQATVTGIDTAITTALETAGLTASVEATATADTKVALLGAKVAEYGKRSGAQASKPKADGDSFEEELDQDKDTSLINSMK
ncbi:S49 family peptidase [Flavobacterium sp. 14A]|uniref:S49 family peptidase n=1 Tax=Flavobacterium sp. 14A TaxID=2735896 RepID=UPI00156F2381|nr:S49 family peptidase [Flavobacterium sp. 14A]NRT11517.1 protease-4 [Flavobacterium sp. 14A]